MLAGVEESQVDEAIQVVRQTLSPIPSGEKRATCFVVPVQKFEQI
jgi:uncharacterized protein YaaQ